LFTTLLPPEFFTQSSEVFELERPSPNEEASSDPKEALEIVAVLAFTRHAPVLRPGREWLAIDHQCGGYACEQQRMIATRLNLRPSISSEMLRVAQVGYFAESGHFNRDSLLASRIAAYIAALARIGLDCECTRRFLTESLYPVDATQENLNRIAEDAPDLDSIAHRNGHSRARYSDQPAVFFLTQNSD